MTEKELKKLTRAELLELLLMQTRESELLRSQLEAAREELDDRSLRIREAGNLADAVLVINGVLDSTQKAAEQYLENITRMEEETRIRCHQMLDEAKIDAERIRAEAAGRPPDPAVEVPEVPEQETPTQPDEETPTGNPLAAFLVDLSLKIRDRMRRGGYLPQ